MKTGIKIASLVCFLAMQTTNAQKEKSEDSHKHPNKTEWSASRADGHAPIGVMGDHMHRKGGWMVSYRNMYMRMDGNLKGSDAVSNTTIHGSYMIAPQKMTMQMHMLGAMYAPSDRLTLMGMLNYASNDMDLLTRPMMGSVTFETASKGFGDVKLGALYKLFNKNKRSMHLNLGLSLPTGSLNERGVTPMSTPNDIRLGYAMQLGSGTWDVSLGTTYLKQYKNMSFGSQLTYLQRLGENEEGYTLGNKWNATFWTAYKISRKVSTSLRLNYSHLGRTEGKDATFMNSMMATVFDAKNTGKKQLDVLVGINYAIFKGALKGMRFEIEAGLPTYQDVNGIQMENKFALTTGIQYAFGH